MTTVDPQQLDLATLASLAGNAASAHLLAELHRLGHHGTRVSHGYLFQHLVDRTPTVGEVAELLNITQQAVSKIVVELERLGYVERLADPRDRRARRIRLTDRGRTMLEDARRARAAMEAGLVADLGTEAVTAARAVLAALLQRVGGTDSVAHRRVRPVT